MIVNVTTSLRAKKKAAEDEKKKKEKAERKRKKKEAAAQAAAQAAMPAVGDGAFGAPALGGTAHGLPGLGGLAPLQAMNKSTALPAPRQAPQMADHCGYLTKVGCARTLPCTPCFLLARGHARTLPCPPPPPCFRARSHPRP